MGIWQYYKQAGGFKLLIQYWKAHVLGYAFLEFILLGKSKTALEIFRLAVSLRSDLYLSACLPCLVV